MTRASEGRTVESVGDEPWVERMGGSVGRTVPDCTGWGFLTRGGRAGGESCPGDLGGTSAGPQVQRASRMWSESQPGEQTPDCFVSPAPHPSLAIVGA